MAPAIGSVLKHTLNRLTLRIAHGGGAFAIVKHVGRKSGTPYETPIIAKPVPGGLMIELTYGDRVDWYRNVRAAGGCVILLGGAEWVITGFEEVDAATGRAAFTPLQRGVLLILRRKHFVRFLGAPAAR
jgi:deazaflavin-dependent oxidoreductase (nitroreductase family)